MYLQDLKSRKNIFNQEMCHDEDKSKFTTRSQKEAKI